MNLYDFLTVDEYSQQLFSETDRSDLESEGSLDLTQAPPFYSQSQASEEVEP